MFPDADQVILDRQLNRHVAFGAGIHRCAGSNLARMMLRVGLEEWLARIPTFHLDPGQTVTWAGGQVRRAVAAVPRDGGPPRSGQVTILSPGAGMNTFGTPLTVHGPIRAAPPRCSLSNRSMVSPVSTTTPTAAALSASTGAPIEGPTHFSSSTRWPSAVGICVVQARLHQQPLPEHGRRRRGGTGRGWARHRAYADIEADKADGTPVLKGTASITHTSRPRGARPASPPSTAARTGDHRPCVCRHDLSPAGHLVITFDQHDGRALPVQPAQQARGDHQTEPLVHERRGIRGDGPSSSSR